MRLDKRFLTELTGSLGDLGTFLPIVCGLIMINKVNGASLFLSAGLFYVITGLYFRIPMPVQPLKATSALAMALGVSASTISYVAFFMSAFLFIVAFLNLDKFMARLFTRPIIRGIQLGLAVILIRTAFKLIFVSPDYFALAHPADSLNIYQAFFLLFLPQLPLTLGNSVYAASDTAHTYFKERAKMVTPRSLIVSLGLGNLVSGFAGSIPFCHGSSGITAHYRFGARSFLSNVCIGSIFILAGVIFAFQGIGFIEWIPKWLLGLALAYTGIRHGMLVGDIISFPREFFVALFIGLYTLISGNLGAAFLIGMAMNIILADKFLIMLFIRSAFANNFSKKGKNNSPVGLPGRAQTVLAKSFSKNFRS